MTRRRVGARVTLVVAVAALAVACQTTGSSQRSHKGGAQSAQAFFWEAQSPEGGKLFLLGSVHIGDGRELAFDPRIETDWKTAQELVVELDTTSTSPVDAVEATNRHGMLPAPRTLKEIVRADTYKQVTDYMKQRDYSMDRVDQMRPWFVALIVQDLDYGAAGLKTDNGVDAVLLRRAKEHKPIVALTTLDEQTATFAAMPDPLQETWLTDQLRDSQNLRAYTGSVLQAWEAGDDAKMAALLFPDAANPDQAQFYDRFYANRNQVMTERLAALEADQKPRFVALGAGYLLGPHGIPELLAQRGFKVRRLGGTAKVIGAPTAMAAAPAPTSATPRAAAPAPPAPAVIVAPAPSPPLAAPPIAIPAPAASAPAAPAPAAAPAPPPAATPPSTPTPQAVAQPAPSPPPPGVAAPVASPTAPAPAAAPAPTAAHSDEHDRWLGQDAGLPGGAVPAPTAPTPVAPSPPPPAAQPKSAAVAKPSTAAKSSTPKPAAKKTSAAKKTPAAKTASATKGASAKKTPAKAATTAKAKPAAKKKTAQTQTAPATEKR